MRYYTLLNNVGKSKYVIVYHNGIKKNADGSKFEDIQICRNKQEVKNFIAYLKCMGYVEKGV